MASCTVVKSAFVTFGETYIVPIPYSAEVQPIFKCNMPSGHPNRTGLVLGF